MPNKGLIGIKASQASVNDQSGMHTLNDLHEENSGNNWPIPTTTALSINRNGNVSTYNTGTSHYIHHGSEHVHTITVLTNVSVIWYLWGAAGGSGIYSTNKHGGNGGLAYGTIQMLSGTTYYLYVGKAGGSVVDAASGYDVGGAVGWPNGGYGTMGDATGAGGGGMTMLSKATFSTGMSDSDILLIGGAGGGTTGYSGSGGSGGGTNGQNAGTSGITGATQSAGGTHNGAKLQGGNATGNQSSGSDDGAGGGGGYYGGGGGTSDGKPAAGGSGYINTSLVSSSAFGTSNTISFSGGSSDRVNPPDVNNIWQNSMDTTTITAPVYARGGLSGGGANQGLSGGNGFAYITIA